MFGTVRVEDHIIMRCHEVHYRRFSDPKCLTLKQLEMLFYANFMVGLTRFLCIDFGDNYT